MVDRDVARDRIFETLAIASWLGAAFLYLCSEGAAALAFSPPYSYAENYISDLGVPACGTEFDGRAICSPLHLLVNADFLLQGLLFLSAAAAMARILAGPLRHVLVGVAALNAIGNVLIGLFPETATVRTGSLGAHVVGAILAIVFGNATALVSAWAFRELALTRIYRIVAFFLPLLGAVALALLAWSRKAGAPILAPNGIWERLSVYTITGWELFAAACLVARRRQRHGSKIS